MHPLVTPRLDDAALSGVDAYPVTLCRMTDYESLRRQCRTLESLLDVKLTSYSRLAANIGRGTSELGASSSGERWQDLEGEIDGLLEKVCTVAVFVGAVLMSESLATRDERSTCTTAEQSRRPTLTIHGADHSTTSRRLAGL